ncbi:MAG: chemotaxis response regulator protein-glutamate methylesterase [Spirochaetaceae bacterium]|jgi:two-component system chemotaxis response regulator CheB|nr:chemotaxis response regulator protein-glutamate methylesterase [Spirochaetaceae bacterium]
MVDEISVLIVDDSALMRGVIAKMIEMTPGLVVADRAMNGRFALNKIARVNPDVIVLDLEMPEMNGIEFLKRRKEMDMKIPVVILSANASRGAKITMEALALGASDFIHKPSDAFSTDLYSIKDSLTSMLLAYGTQYRKMTGKKTPPIDYMKENTKTTDYTQDYLESLPKTASAAPYQSSIANLFHTLETKQVPAQVPEPYRKPGKIEIIAIGISTGGPDSLRQIFAQIDSDLNVPIVVVQHMPPGFTFEFARSLDRICPLEVKEAEEGDLIKPGRIIIAQGNKHLIVEKRALAGVVHLSDDPVVSGHRPSVDVLFESVAKAYTNHVLGVIMTGMGKDGAAKLGLIYQEGGITLGQDEASCVVYGMPRVAFELGHVMEQVPLDKMASRICAIAKTEY